MSMNYSLSLSVQSTLNYEEFVKKIITKAINNNYVFLKQNMPLSADQATEFFLQTFYNEEIGIWCKIFDTYVDFLIIQSKKYQYSIMFCSSSHGWCKDFLHTKLFIDHARYLRLLMNLADDLIIENIWIFSDETVSSHFKSQLQATLTMGTIEDLAHDVDRIVRNLSENAYQVMDPSIAFPEDIAQLCNFIAHSIKNFNEAKLTLQYQNCLFDVLISSSTIQIIPHTRLRIKYINGKEQIDLIWYIQILLNITTHFGIIELRMS